MVLDNREDAYDQYQERAGARGTPPRYLGYIEQMLSYSDDGSYTHYYKCPCGKGRVVDDKDATPGFRSHDGFIECDVCREKYEIE